MKQRGSLRKKGSAAKNIEEKGPVLMSIKRIEGINNIPSSPIKLAVAQSS